MTPTNPVWQDYVVLLIQFGFNMITTISSGILALVPSLIQLIVNLVAGQLQQT